MKKILSIILLVVMALTACESRTKQVYSSDHFGYTIDQLEEYESQLTGYYSRIAEINGKECMRFYDHLGNNYINIYFGDDGYANSVHAVFEPTNDMNEEIFLILSMLNIDYDEDTQSLINELKSAGIVQIGDVYIEMNQENIDSPFKLYVYKNSKYRYYFSSDSSKSSSYTENNNYSSNYSDDSTNENHSHSTNINTAQIGTLAYIESVFYGEKTRDAYEIYGAYANTYDIEGDTVLTVIYDESGKVRIAYVTSTSDFPEDAAIELGRALGAVPTGIADSIEQTGEFADSVNEYMIVASYSDGQWFCMYDDGTIDVETQGQAANGGGEIYPEGMYRVGTDIPEGIYYIYTDSSCYWEVSSDSTGDFGSIIGNGNINNNAYVTVYEGQYLTVDRGSFYNIATREYEMQNSVGEGMYWVGHDIPVGEYVLTPEAGESAYWAIYSSSESRRDIMENGNEDTTIYITVSDGQFLEINRGSIELVQ